MNLKRPMLYATIWEKMSAESVEEIKHHQGFENFHHEKDPLALWKAISQTHKVATTSKVDGIVKLSARTQYQNVKQGAYESIIAYKERFTAALQAYEEIGNPKLPDSSIAMDFMERLDDNRYGQFKIDIINNIAQGSMAAPPTLNSMYMLASERLTLGKRGSSQTLNATFITKADKNSGARHKGKKQNPEEKKKLPKKETQDKATEVPKKTQRDKSKDVCFGCGEKGHHSYECPNQSEDENEGDKEPSNVRATRKVMSVSKRFCGPHEVILDNASDISVMHPRFLSNIIETHDGEGFAGIGGEKSVITHIGHLDGFFDCAAVSNARANILSQGQVEEIYDISYLQGDKYIIHMTNGDLVFKQQGKVYVADMSEWAIHPNFATTIENENQYTKAEVEKAKEAYEFMRNAGYPSEEEATHMVQDGNVTDVPLTATDIRRAFKIYGRPTEAIRGKTTKNKISRQVTEIGIKEQRTEQVLYTDVMKVRRQAFLVSLVEPLQILIQTMAGRETAESLGKALQSHLDLVRSRGFIPVRVHTDPQSAFRKLTNAFPGVELDVSGAGDHLDKVDIRIRRIKELMRSVIAGLPWKLPNENIKDLVAYAISRINSRRSGSQMSDMAPRVAFTGRKIIYNKEFTLAFGDYCECYNPQGLTGEVDRPRTEPCVALCPTGNANGSWMFLNLVSN